MKLRIRFLRGDDPLMPPGCYAIRLPDSFEGVWILVQKAEPGEIDVEVPE